MKINTLYLILITSVFFSSCKKESKIEDPDGCGSVSTDVLKINITGVDEAGSAFTITIDTANKDTGLTYYWQLPDGSKVKGTTYSIPVLKKENRGTYHAFYTTSGGCESFKTSLEIKAPGIGLADVPCSLQQNYYDLKSVLGYENKTMPKAIGGKSGEFYKITCGTYQVTPLVEIELNVSDIAVGEYELVSFPSTEYSHQDRVMAWFKTRAAGSLDFFTNSGGKLYIIKNNGAYEIIICATKMNYPGLTAKPELNMRLIMN